MKSLFMLTRIKNPYETLFFKSCQRVNQSDWSKRRNLSERFKGREAPSRLQGRDVANIIASRNLIYVQKILNK